MNTYIFGKYRTGDKIILKHFQSTLGNCEYLGEKVDLSRIQPDKKTLIVITNPIIFKLDLNRVLGYINKDISKPLVVLRKNKTFATFFFEPNFKIDKITTNKSYTFAGILYIPENYLSSDKQTMSEIFRSVPLDDWRIYFINNREF